MCTATAIFYFEVKERSKKELHVVVERGSGVQFCVGRQKQVQLGFARVL